MKREGNRQSVFYTVMPLHWPLSVNQAPNIINKAYLSNKHFSQYIGVQLWKKGDKYIFIMHFTKQIDAQL